MITTEPASTRRKLSVSAETRSDSPSEVDAPAAPRELVHGALGCPSLDEIAQQDICAALLAAPGLDAREIEVEMTTAGVLLRGTVATADDRARAICIARRVAAPRLVSDALRLNAIRGDTPSAAAARDMHPPAQTKAGSSPGKHHVTG